MKLFSSFFSRREEELRDLKAVTAPFTMPGVQLVHTDEPSLSHFGGDPSLPAGIEWPQHDGRNLTFIARISLSELQRARRLEWLPEQGALLFFYDMEKQPWGYDPKDKGSWAVLHVPDLSAPLVGDGARREDSFPQKTLGFRGVDTYPSTDREAIEGLDLSDKEAEAYYALSVEPFGDHPMHQVSGWTCPVQGDGMELECQLASNGIDCGSPSAFETPRAKALSPGASDWRLLLQLDSDDDLDVMWGDAGMLYFWVREQEAAAGRFDNTWLILQCT